jgi:protein O-GlcNAc transferase
MNALLPVYEALAGEAWHAARTRCGDILQTQGDVAAVHHAMGLAFCGEARFTDAVPCLARAQHLEPDNPRWARDLGAAYGQLEQWADIVGLFTPLLDRLDSEALALYLTAAVEAKRAGAALAELNARRPAPLPDDPQFLWTYGTALAKACRFAEAEANFQQCLAAAPDTAEAHEGLAFVYRELKQPQRALHHARECVRLRPRSGRARLRLAHACCERGLAEEGRQERLRTEGLPLTADEQSIRIYLMQFDPSETGESIERASRRMFADLPPLAPFIRRSTRARTDGHGRLRVGYLSGEYHSTPAYYFYRPFLSQHDRSAVEVLLYCCNVTRDHVTPDYIRWAEHWRDCAHLDDAALAEAVRADELDVLVDLSGHFKENRLRAVAARLAPVQVSFPDYPGTLGCPAVDYLVTDIWTSPIGTERQYTEQLHRLDCGYVKYAAPQGAPAVRPLPMRANGYPTFGIFQRLLKFNDRVWDSVAAVLREAPDARLLIQNGDQDVVDPASVTSRAMRRELERRGVDPCRLTLKGPRPLLDHLAAVAEVDVALDTFPYNGQTTTCESVWMGVPVVTLPGDTHASRVTAALLTRIGHGEWIANSPDNYAAIAASLVSDAGRLERIRHRLRDDAIDGGLADGASLARELELSYRAFIRDAH